MTTHPKGKPGWRERDDANALRRKRRLARGERHQLLPGARIGEAPDRCPLACLPFVGRRVAEFVRERLDSGEMHVGIIPTLPAAAWAEEHRRHDCECYSLCLDEAARAQTEMRLGQGMTWQCGRKCPQRRGA